jgi:hypothetical protein
MTEEDKEKAYHEFCLKPEFSDSELTEAGIETSKECCE